MGCHYSSIMALHCELLQYCQLKRLNTTHLKPALSLLTVLPIQYLTYITFIRGVGMRSGSQLFIYLIRARVLLLP